MIILVAGSRSFNDRFLIRKILDRELLPKLTSDPATWFPPPSNKVVFPGNSDRGASLHIQNWCVANFHPCEALQILPTDGSFRRRNERLLVAKPARAILFGDGRTVEDLTRRTLNIPLLAVRANGNEIRNLGLPDSLPIAEPSR